MRPLGRRSALRRIFAPFRLRTLIRCNEIGYTALTAIVGLVSGLAVVGMQEVIQLSGLWVLGSEDPVSGAAELDPMRFFAGPVAGGELVGLSHLIGRRRFRRVADPIEANAVGGGKIGSLYITAQTVISSGSVGMEVAYTRVASDGASWLGQRLRQLVAACAGVAIAAAFDAPPAGTFYSFELVLAT